MQNTTMHPQGVPPASKTCFSQGTHKLEIVSLCQMVPFGFFSLGSFKVCAKFCQLQHSVTADSKALLRIAAVMLFRCDKLAPGSLGGHSLISFPGIIFHYTFFATHSFYSTWHFLLLPFSGCNVPADPTTDIYPIRFWHQGQNVATK